MQITETPAKQSSAPIWLHIFSKHKEDRMSDKDKAKKENRKKPKLTQKEKKKLKQEKKQNK